MASDPDDLPAGAPPGTPPDAAAAARQARDAMYSISGQIRYVSTGERAHLRRLNESRRSWAEGVVTRLLQRARRFPETETGFDRWLVVAHGAAMIAGTAARPSHDPNRALGAALHEAGYAESRLVRLLNARGPALEDQAKLAMRMVARKGTGPVNLWTLYHLLGTAADEADDATEARRAIARDYYAAQARSN